MAKSYIDRSTIRFSPARAADHSTGLLGFVTCQVGGLLLDGIAVRRTRDDRITLSYPRGRGKCPPVRPVNDAARVAIEREVLGAIDLGALAPATGDGQ